MPLLFTQVKIPLQTKEKIDQKTKIFSLASLGEQLQINCNWGPPKIGANFLFSGRFFEKNIGFLAFFCRIPPLGSTIAKVIPPSENPGYAPVCIYMYIYVYICIYMYIYVYRGVARGGIRGIDPPLWDFATQKMSVGCPSFLPK